VRGLTANSPRPFCHHTVVLRYNQAMLLRAFLIVVIMSGLSRGGVAPAKVREAIDKGKAWLYTQQKPDGSFEAKPQRDPNDKAWTESGGQWGGSTALIVYALLVGGESPGEAKLSKAITFLKEAELQGVYAIALRCQVWANLPQSPEVKQLLRKDTQQLLGMMQTSGRAKGFWDYLPGTGDGYSHSRGNYAVLGLWAAAQSGVEIPDSVWKQVVEGWIGHQDPTGGWTYKAKEDIDYALTPGMTAAGVATLYIALDYAAPDGSPAKLAPAREAIDKGVKWLSANFEKVMSDQRYDRDFPYATLYAVERVGLASGLRYIGEHDWYERIATFLLAKQRPGGGWHRDNRGSGSPSDTAFAILTLSRGVAPVAMNKLNYGGATAKETDWNARPRDVANVVRFMGRTTERELNWQIVTLDSPAADWHSAPVLYIGGSKSVPMTSEEKQKLKQFVEQGGLVLCGADLSSKVFADSIKKLGAEIFPAREWRELPAEHVIYTNQQFPRSAWKSKPVVLGLSNGVRELMILLPFGDPPRWWQSNNTSSKEEFWQLATDIHQYAAGRENLRLRGDSYVVEEDESIKPTRTIKVARLQYEGNWDPEPGAWQRLAAIALNQEKVKLDIQPRKLGDDFTDCKVAHLTGTDAVKFEPAQVSALRKFVEAGGTLLIDCAGGSSAFAAPAEQLVADFFVESKPEALPVDHPMLRTARGEEIDIAFRAFAKKTVGELSGETRFKVVKKGDRVAVIYSRDDLTAGMVGSPVDGVVGYTPATATELVLRLVMTAK